MEMKIIAITLFLIFCITPPPVLTGLYDYICKEEQLFRPYIRIYQGRSGKLLKTLGPGFHLIDQSLKNLWVCINGPAFLYYAKNTSLGVVYEAPQPLVYSHICEMQNVRPKTPQAKMPTLILSLLAVLLYGNKTDYRLPYIQPFTAPYLFEAKVYKEDAVEFPAHFQNATSVAVIGRSDCKLVKGQGPGIPLIFHPSPNAIPATCDVSTVQTSTPTCDSATAGPGLSTASSEIAGSICRLGFGKDILNASILAPTDAVKENLMKGLVNSEPIGAGSCGSQDLDKADFDEKKAEIDSALNNATNDDLPIMATWEADYDAKCQSVIDAFTAEIAEIDAKITPTGANAQPPNAKTLVKLKARKASLEEALTLETTKKTEFPALYAKMTAAKSVSAPGNLDSDANSAVTAWTTVETKSTELEKLVSGETQPNSPTDIDTKKKEVYDAKKAAIEASATAWTALYTYEMDVAKFILLVKQVQKSFEGYTPTKPVSKVKKPKVKKRVEYSQRSDPTKYEIKPGTLGDCTSLPVMGGAQGQCAKGKPDRAGSCDLFKAVLGLDTSPWQADAEWKEDVLKDLGAIFSTACPYFPNRGKFLLKLNRLMMFYLKSAEHFNLAKPAEGTSSACVIIKDWMNGEGVPPLVTTTTVAPVQPNPAPAPQPEPNLIRRPFWDHIMAVLKDCKESKKNTLVFMDRSELYGKWKWVKFEKNGSTSEHDIIPLKEQAEEEFVFNWVIDMVWRIFATVLGICVVEHEDRIPHIASKFHSLFTEDFLIPLAESWINAKDNVIFQWIIGEFYNGEAENWAQRCMEASFQRSDRLKEFRPPRSLFVNCESEYNYFIEGRLASEGGILPMNRDKYQIVYRY